MSSKDYKYFTMDCIENPHDYYTVQFTQRRDLLDHSLRLLIRALCDSGNMKVFDEFNAELIPILANKFRNENKYKPLHKDSNIFKPNSIRHTVSIPITEKRLKLALSSGEEFYKLVDEIATAGLKKGAKYGKRVTKKNL